MTSWEFSISFWFFFRCFRFSCETSNKNNEISFDPARLKDTEAAVLWWFFHTIYNNFTINAHSSVCIFWFLSSTRRGERPRFKISYYFGVVRKARALLCGSSYENWEIFTKSRYNGFDNIVSTDFFLFVYRIFERERILFRLKVKESAKLPEINKWKQILWNFFLRKTVE